jgi:hypothetical protein
MSSNKYRLQSGIVAAVVGSSKLITLPASSLLRVNAHTATATVIEPANLSGTRIRYNTQRVAVADEPSDNAPQSVNGVDPKPVPTPEHIAQREHYQNTISGVLKKILDWENLPAVDAESFAHGIRDLGRVTDHVDVHIAGNPKRLRNWIHHVNMKIPSRSLTVELARFPNQEQHIVLVLTTVW